MTNETNNNTPPETILTTKDIVTDLKAMVRDKNFDPLQLENQKKALGVLFQRLISDADDYYYQDTLAGYMAALRTQAQLLRTHKTLRAEQIADSKPSKQTIQTPQKSYESSSDTDEKGTGI